MHENSIRSYAEIRGQLTGRRLEILLFMEAKSRAVTDREVMLGLQKSDMNAVRPRITELVKLKLLVECGAVRCEKTGKRVRTTCVRFVEPKQRELF